MARLTTFLLGFRNEEPEAGESTPSWLQAEPVQVDLLGPIALKTSLPVARKMILGHLVFLQERVIRCRKISALALDPFSITPDRELLSFTDGCRLDPALTAEKSVPRPAKRNCDPGKIFRISRVRVL